jgi:hypothetical protein
MRLKKKSQRGISAASSKKSLCAGCAEANSERNLYSPLKSPGPTFHVAAKTFLFAPASFVVHRSFLAQLGRIKRLSLTFQLMGLPDICPCLGRFIRPTSSKV